MAALLPPLTDASREAFRAQFDEEQARALGATTKAVTVELEAMRMAVTAHEFLRGPSAGAVRYAPQRLTWFIESLGRLAEARAADVSTRRKADTTRAGRSLAEESAARTLGELSQTMTEVVGGRNALARGLSAMRARVEPKTDTGANLEAHADLLAEWLGATDPVQQALLAGYNLTAGDVSRARADLAALRSEQRTAVGVGSSRFDGPAVNALEGRVLFEMRTLRKSFHRARERSGDPTIPRFVISPSLQRIFAAAPGDDAPAPDAPTT